MSLSDALESRTLWFIAGFFTCAVLAMVGMMILEALCSEKPDLEDIEEEEKP